jgi:hypothetical protein
MANIDLKPRDETPKSLFNPLSIDVITSIRDDDNKNQDYTIPSMEIKTFPAYLADRIKRDLLTTIRNSRNLGLVTEKEEKDLEKEVEVENR